MAAACYSLGLLCCDLGDTARAEPLAGKVLEVRRGNPGPHAPATLAAMAAMALLRLQQKTMMPRKRCSEDAAGYEKRLPNNVMRYVCQTMLGAS